MRYADLLHKRLWKVCKFNANVIKTIDRNTKALIGLRENAELRLPNFIINVFDFEIEWGYVIVSLDVLKSRIVFNKIAKEEIKNLSDFSEDVKKQSWYIEFEKLERMLLPQLKEVEEYESKLISIASEITNRIKSNK